MNNGEMGYNMVELLRYKKTKKLINKERVQCA